MQTLRDLVVGTDFSLHSEKALEMAVDLAKVMAARLTVVHVCELGIGDDEEQRYAQCADTLARMVAQRKNAGVDMVGLLRIGRPWLKLDNVATEVGAYLILIGRHGAGRGLSIEIGHVAEHLVRSASRPVLTVDSDCHVSSPRRAKTTPPPEGLDNHES